MKKIITRILSLFLSICRGIADRLYRLAGRELTDSRWAVIEQFIRFCIVGVTNAAVSYITHCVVLLLIQDKVPYDYIISSTCGFILSVLNAFILNNRYVFKTQHTSAGAIALALLKTYASYALTGLLLNYVLLYLFCDRMGMSKFIAPLLVMVITTPANFLLNKFWAFRKKKSSDEKSQKATTTEKKNEKKTR